jgi:hypothetical protein
LINYELEIRKSIIAAKPGEVVTKPTGHVELLVAQERAKSFAKSKKVLIRILPSTDALKFERIDPATVARGNYAEMDDLAIGQSHFYEFPAPLHSRVRMAASARNRNGEVLLSCSREGGGIRVTRHPLTTGEIKDHGLIHVAPRQSKYGLERLATESEMLLEPATPMELRNMRVAVSTKAINEGWKLVCRKMADGRLKVTRHRDEEGKNA